MRFYAQQKPLGFRASGASAHLPSRRTRKKDRNYTRRIDGRLTLTPILALTLTLALIGLEADSKELAKHVAYAKEIHTKWLTIRDFETTTQLIAALREDDREIWTTDLSQQAHSLYSTATDVLPERLAICMGSELTGASEELLKASDKRVYLPLHGMADSLNVSVAAALVLQRLFVIDPKLVGAMSSQERAELRKKWYPSMARKEAQKVAFAALAQEVNQGSKSVMPFADMRRPDEHRKHQCANVVAPGAE